MVDRPTIETINQQVVELKDVAKDNIDKVLDRGEKLDQLQDRAEELEQNADRFKKTTKRVKEKKKWQDRKMYIIIGVVVTILILAIVLAALGVSGVING